MRVAILLAVLVAVAATTWLDSRRIARWERPLVVMLHPIVAERSADVEAYVRGLDVERLRGLEGFFDREAARWGVQLSPHVIEVVLGPEVHERAPEPPAEPTALSAIAWSLSYRWWSAAVARRERLPPADVRVFLEYHAALPGRALEHSVGLSKARSGVAKLFAAASAEGPNAVVVAHELLHIVGASDKYDEAGQPRAPEGLAEPERQPLYPQVRAEIMAGSIPSSASESKLPDGLDTCVVGEVTAREVAWRP